MAILTPAAGTFCGRRLMRGLFRQSALGILMLAVPICSPAQPAGAQEYQVKAVFLFNFAQFVECPPAAFPDGKGPLVIGVLGEDPFGRVLDEVVQGESVGGRPLAIRRYRRPDEIDKCHILYISQSEAARLGRIIPLLQGRGVLTVSDIDGAARHGVMIRFFSENKRIRLRINLGAARAAGLVISSKLLRSAEIIESREETP